MPGFASLISISGIRLAKTMPFSKSHHQDIHELLEPHMSAISAQIYCGISQLLLDYIPFSPDYTTIIQPSRRVRVIFIPHFLSFGERQPEIECISQKPCPSWDWYSFCKHFAAIRKWPFGRWMLDLIQEVAVKGREGTGMLGLCWDGVFVTLKGREGVRGTGGWRRVVRVSRWLSRCRALVVDGVILLIIHDVSISSLLREARVVCYFSWDVDVRFVEC